jgi:hypothetical protein
MYRTTINPTADHRITLIALAGASKAASRAGEKFALRSGVSAEGASDGRNASKIDDEKSDQTSVALGE